jgi:glycosyltransferase A (GT-A) superfamily protein (DUF2064 family)
VSDRRSPAAASPAAASAPAPTAAGNTLLVIAKTPVPGRVKTRLTPDLTPDQAADVAEAALADTFDAVLAAPAARRVLVLDGPPRPWFPCGLEVVPQTSGGLDVRLAAAFALCSGPALLVGMDTPQLRPDLLAVDWADTDAWFGPAADGGFWALGLRRPDPALLLGVPMSTPRTGAAQLGRLTGAGLRVGLLPELTDIDHVADFAAVAATAPGTRTARLARRLLPGTAVPQPHRAPARATAETGTGTATATATVTATATA